MESLELQKDSFIDNNLIENFSDLIYKVKINNREGYIIFLLEHKSYKDRMTIFQVHKYILESWISIIQKENKKELPIILPMVIYHGKEKWNLKTDVRDMIPGFEELPEYFKQRTPVFKYDFFNITEYKETDFQKLTKLTAMMLKAFKYSFEKDLELVLRVYLTSLEEAKQEESLDTLIYYGEIYLKYIELTNNDIKEEDIMNQIKKLEGKGDVTMGILEKREEKGRLEGVEQGIQKGMQEGRQQGMQQGIEQVARNLLKEGMDIELVQKYTKLPKSKIENIREKMLN